MRRHTGRRLEGAQEVIRAQARHAGEADHGVPSGTMSRHVAQYLRHASLVSRR